MVLVLGGFVVLGERFKGATEKRDGMTVNFREGLCARERDLVSGSVGQVWYRGGLSYLTFLPYSLCLLSQHSYFWIGKQEQTKGEKGFRATVWLC